MTAYRLHFEAANLDAVKTARSGKLGDLRVFSSDFTMQVKDPDNIRLKADMGGGPLYDIGIYCINAARMLFRAEPEEVFASAASTRDPRFAEVPEMVSCVMRYPDDRLATFTCSFGAADVSSYRVIGTKGDLHMQPAFEYAEGLRHRVTINRRSRERQFRKHDQFAAELLYFSDCIRTGKKPEPSGEEGLADVHIIRCLLKSAAAGRPIAIGELPREAHPTPRQRINRPGIRKPKAIHAKSPSGD
jgi:glucose-fructose oxidoreductase